MRKKQAKALLFAALGGAAAVLSAPRARASNPLEYPDNGSAAFSRGGAWLGVANEPIATHYNPAALATQASGFSVEQQLNFPKTCYLRKGPGNTPTGPDNKFQADASDPNSLPLYVYTKACSERDSFPNTIPSISLAWRVTPKLGVGLAVVPPAAYGTADQQFPLMARGYNVRTGKYQSLPAPWRYMQVDQFTAIVFPTVGVGYELFEHFRIGAAFVSGIAVINTSTVGVGNLNYDSKDKYGDHASTDDALSNIRVKDLFVPGVVLSLHWSVLPQLDVALWGRYMDAIQASTGTFSSTTEIFGTDEKPAKRCTNLDACPAGGAAPNNASNNSAFKGALTHFRYPIPPEVRAGVRFHQPRTKSRLLFGTQGEVRDPLHDDLFDVELDGSYTMNSKANTIEVRFRESDGKGAVGTRPTGVGIPPNADRWNGYQDSYGVRLGGQWNAIPDKFGVRGGAWLETRSQDPAWLTVAPIGAMRWGFGGGIVFRQDFIDISFGYQRHESAGLDNHGDGKLRAPVGTGGTCNGGGDNLACDAGKSAAEREQFRTSKEHPVNGGHVTFWADVFTLGATVRF